MSILIKKMEMPKGCWACPFAVGKHYECLFTKKSYNWGLTTRPSDCPLIEVQTPHGRLIDADKLKRHIDKLPALPDGNYAGSHRNLKALINMQKAIIEAEGSGKEVLK